MLGRNNACIESGWHLVERQINGLSRAALAQRPVEQDSPSNIEQLHPDALRWFG
jgi:hypothetical protein